MKDKVILFGAGFYGREAFDGLKDKYEILCFEIGRASCRERV